MLVLALLTAVTAARGGLALASCTQKCKVNIESCQQTLLGSNVTAVDIVFQPGLWTQTYASDLSEQ